MGVVTSCLDILSGLKDFETIEETDSNGRKTITKRKNPWVSGALIVSATTILLVYMDGGKGLLSNIFGSKKALEG